MPSVEISKGYNVNYIEKGHGKVLVFIHGFLASSWVFEAQVDYFSRNYRVIAIDHLGHGKSDNPTSEMYELEDLTQFLEEALAKIIGDEEIILIGHSMGGMIAQIFATTQDLAKRLNGLVLMSTTPKYHNPMVDQTKDAILAGQISLVDENIVRNVFVNLVFESKYQKENPDFINEFVKRTTEIKEFIGLNTMKSILNYDVTDKIKDITVPTLIITSDKDTMVLPQDSDLINEKIPNSKLITLSPNIGHYIQYEAKDEYHKAVEDFIKSI